MWLQYGLSEVNKHNPFVSALLTNNVRFAVIGRLIQLVLSAELTCNTE